MTENNSVKKLKMISCSHNVLHEQAGGILDRISELPDPILSHILSLLPATEDVAGITLLSKRLNSFWSPLSVLNLDFYRFSKTYRSNSSSSSSSSGTPEDDEKMNKRFIGLVERMIVLHQGRHLEEFRLAVDVSVLDNVFRRYSPPPPPLIYNCVHFALTNSNSTIVDLDFRRGGRRDEKEYHYSPFFSKIKRNSCKKRGGDTKRPRLYYKKGEYYYSYYYKLLPPCSSVVQSVTVLKLSGCRFEPLSYKGFKSLKTLILFHVLLPKYMSVRDLLVKCSDLEELHLKQCIVPCGLDIVAPSTSKLKCLVMEYSISGQNVSDERFRWISIRVPSLLKLHFSGPVMITYFNVYFDNLNEVEIYFDELDWTRKRSFYETVRHLLLKLSNVNTLTICQRFLAVLTIDSDAPVKYLRTTLNNLKYLSAETCLYGSELKNFVCFLLSCPNLETLSINLTKPWSWLSRLDKFWESRVLPLDCLQHLKTIELMTFVGEIHEMDFLSYMLDNALVLKKVDISVALRTPIYFSSERNEEEELKLAKAQAEKTKEKILALPRHPDVQIVVTCMKQL